MVVCGEYVEGCTDDVFVTVGGSIRLAIDGDADARLTCGDPCAGGGPFAGCGGRCAASVVDPRIGS